MKGTMSLCRNTHVTCCYNSKSPCCVSLGPKISHVAVSNLRDKIPMVGLLYTSRGAGAGGGWGAT